MNYLANLKFPETYQEVNAKITEWLVLFTCFGYPIQVFMVLAVGADSTPVNLSFRLSYLVISIYLFSYGLFRNRKALDITGLLTTGHFRQFFSPKLSYFYYLLPWVALILFWLIYGIRLIYDLEYKKWHFRDYNNLYIYAWAFGATLIPALAVLLNISAIKFKGFSRSLFLFVFIVTFIIALVLIYLAGSDVEKLYTQRGAIVLTGDVKLKGWHLLNGITMSFYGALLILIALTWFVFYQQKLSVTFPIFFVVCVLLGLFILVAGASRGPLFGLLVISSGILIISLFSYFWRLIKYLKYRFNPNENLRLSDTRERISGRSLIYKPLMVILTLMMLFTVLNKAVKRYDIKLQDLAFTKRLDALTNDTKDINTTFRIDAWKSGWHQFTVNPIFGDSIINDAGYFYSHNIFMDALMSVGIVGTIPFLVWFFLSFCYFIRLPSERKRQLSVLFVAYLAALLLSMTSGGIFTVPEVWILSAAVIGLSQKEGRKEKGEGRGEKGELTIDN